ncbi:hypothetical protein ACFRAO_37035 [Streptomyces sp. NPDC056656]|uniref:hypothetical protein n=1 Tax=Streptomyces sp. NPDC056656 TaxID=3345895 RepID=UPI003699ED65
MSFAESGGGIRTEQIDGVTRERARLKHRKPGEFREVPMPATVRDTLLRYETEHGADQKVATARHEVDDDAQFVAGDGLEGVDLVQRRDGDLARNVLRRDDADEEVLGDSATTACVKKDIFEGVEGVLLGCKPDGAFLHRHDEVFDDVRGEGVDPAGFHYRENLVAEDLIDCAVAGTVRSGRHRGGSIDSGGCSRSS